MGYRIDEETIISNIKIKKINLDIAFKGIKQKFLNKREKSIKKVEKRTTSFFTSNELLVAFW